MKETEQSVSTKADYQAALYERKLTEEAGAGETGQKKNSGQKCGETGSEDAAKREAKAEAEAARRQGRKLKFSYKEQKEWDTIDEDIASLEKAVAELEKEMEAAAANYSRLQELLAEKEAKEAELEEKMDRWMYLSELAEKIAAQ